MAVAARTLVLGNAAAGAEKQALALAAAVGLPHTIQRALPSALARRLPTAAQLGLLSRLGGGALGLAAARAPFPLLAISCGRAAIASSVALRAASGGRTLTVHVQRPPCDASQFDLVVAPAHDFAGWSIGSPPPGVCLSAGSLHDVTPAALAAARAAPEAAALAALPRPRLAVLLGGPTTARWWQRPRAPELTAERARALLRSAAGAAAERGGSVLVTCSRRTPAAVVDEVDDLLAGGGATSCPVWRWRDARDGPNPYTALLATADHIVVTADSINMLSEACGTGKPVYTDGADACRGRFVACHDTFRQRGLARPWAGVLDDESWGRADEVGDTSRAAACVARLVAERARSLGVELPRGVAAAGAAAGGTS